jgi:hypothetical protein
VRYRVLTVVAVLGYAASTWLFCTKLTTLLDTGTCASGGPYVSARQCPEGTGTDVLLLGLSIVGFFLSMGIAGLRGRRPGGGGLGFGGMALLGWVTFFTASGAVSLVHALTSDVIGDDGKLGGIIVGATFLLLGVPPLLFALPAAIRDAFRSRDVAAAGPVTYADNAGEPGWMSTMRAGSQLAGRDSTTRFASFSGSGTGGGGDSIAQLERLQRLREQGALSDAEFEQQKRRILGG